MKKIISILVPTKGRPDNILRLIQSAKDTAKDFEFVFVVDKGDTSSVPTHEYPIIEQDGLRLGDMWNLAYKHATGDIILPVGDDMIFRTMDWDKIARAVIESYADRIVLVFGNDGYWKEKFATHCFLHRNWVEAIGFVNAPYFEANYCDTWLNYLADAIGRKRYIPEIYTEHMHPVFGKAETDEVYKMREAKVDDSTKLWEELKDKRDEDVKKLLAVMQK